MITDIKCCIIKVFQYTLFSDAKSQTTGRKYVPRCRRSFDKAKYILIEDHEADNELPDGYQLIAPEAKLAVKTTWLQNVLESVQKPRKATSKLKFDVHAAIIKRMIDAFYTPYELAVEGGSSMFVEDKIYNGLQLYAAHELGVGMSDFNIYWNQKMAWARKVKHRLNQQPGK